MNILPRNYALVCCGGAVGTAARYAVHAVIPQNHHSYLRYVGPWDLLVVNVIGSCLLVIFTVYHQKRGTATSSRMLLIGGTGFCGAVTTYSSLAYQIILSIDHHHLDWAITQFLTHFIASVLLGILTWSAATKFFVARENH